MEAVILILDGARGNFIPRDFLTDGLGDIDKDYCMSWGLDANNSDLWGICYEKMTTEEKENFGFD